MSNVNLIPKELIKILDYPHLLGHLCKKTKLTELHSDWIHHCWDTENHSALQAHRGSYKTTAIDVIGIPYHLLTHPDDRIAVVRKTHTDACDVVRSIAQCFDIPEVKAIFEMAHGVQPKFKVRRADRIEMSFKSTATPELSVTAHGLDGSLTGKHYDRILCDDTITMLDRWSSAEREHTKNIKREIYTNIIDPGKPVIDIGTPWHKDDAWTVTAGAGILIPKFNVYTCKIRSPEEIKQIKLMSTPAEFACNYELIHLPSENNLFKDPRIGDWKKEDITQVVAHVDAAFDGTHFCAFTIMGLLPRTKEIMAKGWVYAGNIKDWIPFICKMLQEYNVEYFYIEDNADKGYTFDEVKKQLTTTQVWCKDYHEQTNKHVKISSYLYHGWPKIIWDKDTDSEYMIQIVDYQEKMEPDDAPDSAASLLRESGMVELVDEYNFEDTWEW